MGTGMGTTWVRLWVWYGYESGYRHGSRYGCGYWYEYCTGMGTNRVMGTGMGMITVRILEWVQMETDSIGRASSLSTSPRSSKLRKRLFRPFKRRKSTIPHLDAAELEAKVQLSEAESDEEMSQNSSNSVSIRGSTNVSTRSTPGRIRKRFNLFGGKSI
ncbi:unnamed protein product [Bursaphelenchus okinawaensis]|uniref:Uncharacterized protein n=1 Tax=Bursaphelenchus okinawaensis TaxID=465554 RepID=A0A811JS09_9BILA|nr:unnamed protein product [Bursaphelenchus okinawaensis]CAG9080216.1 unnamed protein product [Bursaphelenchus okinawaensis]